MIKILDCLEIVSICAAGVTNHGSCYNFNLIYWSRQRSIKKPINVKNQFSVNLDKVQRIEIHSLFFISLLLVCNESNMGMVLVAVMLLLFTAISAKCLQQVYHSVSLQA